MTDNDSKSAATSLNDLSTSINITDQVEGYSIDRLYPGVVAKPSDIEQVSQIMSVAWEYGLSVVPWGGGTRQTLGNAIKNFNVVIDLSDMNSVIRHNYGDLTATVEAGATISSIQNTLKAHGQFVAIDAALSDKATLGGTLAAGVSGPLKWQFGSPRDAVIGMKVVQPDGVVTKSGGEVVKNVSGYDMARLHIGALGTLGIIVEVSLKLTPLPRSEKTVTAAFSSIDDCIDAGLNVFNSHVMPLALSSFDAHANISNSIVQSDGKFFLCVRIGGRPRTVDRQVNDAMKICQDSSSLSVETVTGLQAEAIWQKIADFGWREAASPAIVCRISVNPGEIARVTSSLKTLESNGLQLAIVTHIGYGTVLASWFGETPDDEMVNLITQARDLVHKSGGRVIIERCAAGVKSHFDVWDEVGTPISTMRRMKEQYDSKGILNPGRFVGGI